MATVVGKSLCLSCGWMNWPSVRICSSHQGVQLGRRHLIGWKGSDHHPILKGTQGFHLSENHLSEIPVLMCGSHVQISLRIGLSLWLHVVCVILFPKSRKFGPLLG